MSFISNISVFASLFFERFFVSFFNFFFTEYMMKLPEKMCKCIKTLFSILDIFFWLSALVRLAFAYASYYPLRFKYIWNREVESKQCTRDQRHATSCFTENCVMLRTTWWFKISYESAICTKWCSKNSLSTNVDSTICFWEPDHVFYHRIFFFIKFSAQKNHASWILKTWSTWISMQWIKLCGGGLYKRKLKKEDATTYGSIGSRYYYHPNHRLM